MPSRPPHAGRSSRLERARPVDPAIITKREQHAMDVRKQHGLRSDLDYVRRLETAAGTTEGLLGIPLTPVERADVSRRNALP